MTNIDRRQVARGIAWSAPTVALAAAAPAMAASGNAQAVPFTTCGTPPLSSQDGALVYNSIEGNVVSFTWTTPAVTFASSFLPEDVNDPAVTYDITALNLPVAFTRKVREYDFVAANAQVESVTIMVDGTPRGEVATGLSPASTVQFVVTGTVELDDLTGIEVGNACESVGPDPRGNGIYVPRTGKYFGAEDDWFLSEYIPQLKFSFYRNGIPANEISTSALFFRDSGGGSATSPGTASLSIYFNCSNSLAEFNCGSGGS